MRSFLSDFLSLFHVTKSIIKSSSLLFSGFDDTLVPTSDISSLKELLENSIDAKATRYDFFVLL
jgi:hypothetical protein